MLSSLVPLLPGVSYAQQMKEARIGALINGKPTMPIFQRLTADFTNALAKLGWKENQNIRIEYRWADEGAERSRAYAAELIAANPDAILSSGTASLTPLAQMTHEIPIVFLQVSDPVAQGFVPNLVNPGGNITGFAPLDYAMTSKWIQLLKQVAPSVRRVAVPFRPETSPQAIFYVKAIAAAGRELGVDVTGLPLESEQDAEKGFSELARGNDGGLIIVPDDFVQAHVDAFAALAIQKHLPTVAGFFVSGGLLMYFSDQSEQWVAAASYIDRILKGAKPGDLPIQFPTKYHLGVNLKTAKALGVAFPPGLIASADQVIE